MFNNTVTDEFESSIASFDDEVDCAILSDPEFEESLADMASKMSTSQEELEDDDLVDVNVDYTDSVPGADIVDMDADDIIADIGNYDDGMTIREDPDANLDDYDN